MNSMTIKASYLTIDTTVLLEYIECIHIMLGAYYFVNIILNALLSSNLTDNGHKPTNHTFLC